jgi:hypothetical protein
VGREQQPLDRRALAAAAAAAAAAFVLVAREDVVAKARTFLAFADSWEAALGG